MKVDRSDLNMMDAASNSTTKFEEKPDPTTSYWYFMCFLAASLHRHLPPYNVIPAPALPELIEFGKPLVDKVSLPKNSIRFQTQNASSSGWTRL